MSSELPGGGLGYALNSAAHAWRASLAARLADQEVTPPQFFVLAALLHSRPARQAAVARAAGTDANTASQIVRGLERRGLVTRERDPADARALMLTLTDEGLAVARECAARARALNAEFFAGVAEQELYEVLLGLGR
jgi:DNA-binding MarR family transcriptional regulator